MDTEGGSLRCQKRSLQPADIIVREHGGRRFSKRSGRGQAGQASHRPGVARAGPTRRLASAPRPRAGGRFDERARRRRRELVDAYVADAADLDAPSMSVGLAASTFREVAQAYCAGWRRRGAKPSTLRDRDTCSASRACRTSTAGDGRPRDGRARRPAGVEDHDARDQRTTGSVSATRASSLSQRGWLRFGRRDDERVADHSYAEYGQQVPQRYLCRVQPRLQAGHVRASRNPVRAPISGASRSPGALVFYSPEEIEAIARALASRPHRDPAFPASRGDRIARKPRTARTPR